MASSIKPGPKKPTKYPKTGPNYSKWGELEYAGYGYNPETDTYFFDPAIQARYEVAAKKALRDEFEKKPPSIWEQGAAAALPVVLGKGVKSLFSGDGLGGLLGLGSGTSSLFGGSSASSLIPSIGSAVSNYGGDFVDAVSDYGGDFLDAVSDFGGDVIDLIGGLF